MTFLFPTAWSASVFATFGLVNDRAIYVSRERSHLFDECVYTPFMRAYLTKKM